MNEKEDHNVDIASPTGITSSRAAKDLGEHARACTLIGAGKLDEGFELLQELAGKGSSCWEVYNDLGAIAVVQDDQAAAEVFFREASRCEDAPPAVSIRLASVLALKGEHEHALATLSPVLRADGMNADALALARDLIGAAPALSAVAWARLVADLRTPLPETRKALERLTALESENKQLVGENRKLEGRLAALKRSGRRNGSGGIPAEGWGTLHRTDERTWLEALLASVESKSFEGYPLPGFPSDEIQVGMVGSSNEGAIREGFKFYQIVRNLCEQQGARWTGHGRMLDFGTGWGRFARIFLRDFRPENILGIDVDPGFIDLCKETFPYGRFETVPALPPSEIANDSFDLVVAYSVFSHLAEHAANAWIEEFTRVLKPGGFIAFTTWGRGFAAKCQRYKGAASVESEWHKALAEAFPDLAATESAYDRGEFIYSPTGGGDLRPSSFYGEAMISRGYVEKHWTDRLELIEFIDDAARLPQALVVLKKPLPTASIATEPLGSGTPVSDVVSTRDEMFNYARTRLSSDEAAKNYYMRTGHEVARGLVGALETQGLVPGELDLLEFAAGYGRVTRWLKPHFRSLKVSDLEQDMLDFHRRSFGLDGFLSALDPAALADHAERFDVILVFSLFTHLSRADWLEWLATLARLLRPGGHLVISTHGYPLFAELKPDEYGDPATWTEDFVFWETNETCGRLDPAVYGCNIVTDRFVLDAVSRLGNFSIVQHFPKGNLDRYHDMYVIRRDPNDADVVLESSGWCPTCGKWSASRSGRNR